MTESASKVTVHIQTPFTLTIDLDGKGGKPVFIPAGVQQVAPEIAAHWYTKAHMSHGGLGTPEYAYAARQSSDSAFLKAKAMVEEFTSLEDAAAEAEKSAGTDVQESARTRLGGMHKTSQASPSPAAGEDDGEASGGTNEGGPQGADVVGGGSEAPDASDPPPVADAKATNGGEQGDGDPGTNDGGSDAGAPSQPSDAPKRGPGRPPKAVAATSEDGES